MNIDHIVERIVGLTREEEIWLRLMINQGTEWHNYYTGEYTIIRKDKLSLLMKDQKKLRALRQHKDITPPKHCKDCGTKIRTMPCDEELTYCPQCDLPHIGYETT